MARGGREKKREGSKSIQRLDPELAIKIRRCYAPFVLRYFWVLNIALILRVFQCVYADFDYLVELSAVSESLVDLNYISLFEFVN